MDLYSIGEILIDFIPGDQPASYIRAAGGAPANVAIAVAKNGLSAGMNCLAGDDDFGRFLIETLKENNVRVLTSGLCKDAVTTMAFVTLAEDGDRSFTFARKPGADMLLSEGDVKEADINDSAIIHAGSFSLSEEPAASATIKALRLGNAMGKIVSFDVNYRNVVWKDDRAACADKVFLCLPYIDFLKISEEEADMLGDEDDFFALMEKYGITLIAETLGADGVRCFWDGKIIDVPGRKAVCVDATGAGDAFWGGFLSCLRIQGIDNVSQLSEDILRNALIYGNTSGWICVQSKGAIPSLPTRAEIEKNLSPLGIS